MRSYERSHPWLNFRIDLQRASPALWLALGEAQSKCEHISNTPLHIDIAEKLHQIYLAKGVHGTTAIEGNTLSEQQVLLHIEKKLHLPPSQEYLEREISNIIQACNEIVDKVVKENSNAQLSLEEICAYNRLVLEGLTVEEGVVPGEFRTFSVGVGRYRAAPAEDCAFLVEKLCQWLATDFVQFPNYALAMCILKAIIAHVYLELIHPFGDGNGRTGRLIEFHLLLSCGIPSAAAHLLSNHYNLTRQEYYRQLDYISQSQGDLYPFIKYAVDGFVDGLREQLSWIRSQLFDMTWRDYVHGLFKDKSSKADKRRRDLALALDSTTPVKIAKIPEISPHIATLLAGISRKTLQRDLEELKQLELVELSPNGARARQEVVFTFLPLKVR